MQRIEGEIVICRPVANVFDFVADERNEPQYHPQMRRVEMISTGPIACGTRFHSELGRNVEMVWEITAYERPQRLGGVGCAVVRLFTAVPALDTQGTLTFDPVPGGTRMRWLCLSSEKLATMLLKWSTTDDVRESNIGPCHDAALTEK